MVVRERHFNPPDLSGLVSERTAMEAIMTHSDNTATDMVLKEAGPGNVAAYFRATREALALVQDGLGS